MTYVRVRLALDRMQPSPWRLPEVGGQEKQGQHDEQHEHGSSATDSLVVHQ